MNEMNNITIILPIHEINSSLEQYFAIAIASLNNQVVFPDEVIIVTSADEALKTFLNAFDYGEIKPYVKIIENPGATDFASQMNFGVANAKSEWISFLEVDDEYSRIWLKNAIRYRNAYPDVNIFLPIVVDVDASGEFKGFTNEPVWAAEFCDDLGMLDITSLLGFQNFNFDGMVIRKSVYEAHGGIKPTIKLTFMYEFLLRMVHYDAKVMVIPKIGYKHTNQRPNSLFNVYKETMAPDEAKWWLAQAKKEYYYTNLKRTLEYIPTPEEPKTEGNQ